MIKLSDSREYFLVQKITIGDNEVLMEHLVHCAYIENSSMEGVKLVLKLMDAVGLYRDDYGIKENAELEVTFADPYGRGDDIWIETFVIVKPLSEEGFLYVNGFAKAVHQLKQPSLRPVFFNDKQPKDILKVLCPDLKVEASTYERGGTYHLNAGGTPARLIRSMARDYGSVCFVSRGKIYFKPLKRMDLTPQLTIENGNPHAEISFPKYTMIGERSMYERVHNKAYYAWDTVKGIEVAKGGANGALTSVSVGQAKALNNQHIAIIPLLDVELTGNSKILPVMPVSVLFHKRFTEVEMDESLPEVMLVESVSHYQEGNRYLCRVVLGEVNV